VVASTLPTVAVITARRSSTSLAKRLPPQRLQAPEADRNRRYLVAEKPPPQA